MIAGILGGAAVCGGAVGTFAAYQDYDSNNSLDSVQAILCEQIIETLVEDIFNATVADWK